MARIELCTGLTDSGHEVEGLLGVLHEGMMVTRPYESECGRFAVHPSYYGLSEDEADRIVAHNAPILREAEATLQARPKP